MLAAVTLLLTMQLLGEALARGLGLAVPGPVIGLALLALAFAGSRRLREAVEPTANGLLRHLSLLFVPAATGIVEHLPRLASEGLAIGAAVLLSTAASLAVTALTFRAVAQRLGAGEGR
jgi:holin-like protein